MRMQGRGEGTVWGKGAEGKGVRVGVRVQGGGCGLNVGWDRKWGRMKIGQKGRTTGRLQVRCAHT